MKQDTAIVVTKCVCYVAIGGSMPLTSSLAQWANSGEWPPDIVWVVIIGTCVVGAASQLLSFLSSSYSEYKAKQNGNSGSASAAPKP